MTPSLPVCMPTAAVLGQLCQGCLSRAHNLPRHRLSCLPRQMSRWNSQDTCISSAARENPRVLITGNTKSESFPLSRPVCVSRERWRQQTRFFFSSSMIVEPLTKVEERFLAKMMLYNFPKTSQGGNISGRAEYYRRICHCFFFSC